MFSNATLNRFTMAKAAKLLVCFSFVCVFLSYFLNP